MRIKTIVYCLLPWTHALIVTSPPPRHRHTTRYATVEAILEDSRVQFDMDIAVFCGGLAFDAYVEPPADSSRWETGSKGWKVAFCSEAFTRNLYQGLVKVKVKKILDLPSSPDGDNAAEQIVTGKGVDACLLVAVLEGHWKEDIDLLEKEQYHDGVLGLTGAAHVGRTSTAWSNVDERASQQSLKQRGEPKPYHIPATWGKGGIAVWPEAPPQDRKQVKESDSPKKGRITNRSNQFFLYVQDPSTARLVFTVADDNRVGGLVGVGSTHKRLTSLIPKAANAPEQWMDEWKKAMIEQARRKGETDEFEVPAIDPSKLGASWEGKLKLISKPRKKSKQGQIMTGVAAGAAVAGPMGAAAGFVIGNLYEGQVQGVIECELNYLPILPNPAARRPVYTVKGGMPGIDWGELFQKYQTRKSQLSETSSQPTPSVSDIGQKLREMKDLEHCFFVNHDITGGTCAVYRSLEKKVIVVSFRGTCEPVDLFTDTTLVQEPWIEGEDMKDPEIIKVHSGFRTSMDSISRRLKELILATPTPGDDISDYDMLVTGHSLGGALATLFTADIGEHGIDAGRGLPQSKPSDVWWKSIANTLIGQKAADMEGKKPPRPKSLYLYNFGSPRVGNERFRIMFDSLLADGRITQAYRVVNGEDVVARLPRTVNALVFGNVGYDHVGTTVLVKDPSQADDGEPLLWVEGESDDNTCPVRDGIALTNPLSEGSLLADLINATKTVLNDEDTSKNADLWTKVGSAAMMVTERIKTVSASDLASVLGIDQKFTEREVRIIQSLLEGKAVAHHMEDQYYGSMGRACGYKAVVGEELVELQDT
ncbi:hypothetical protein FisN_7Hh308 [Fistulifera solaris]|uniref:Fungal lipase-type domain-containing protein n=1 Tax=Fistulifera solaris TaxID=1519565 RepID=A0A1Z5KS11_FISSO|nr:hypothetical protein FisN_7Hh308 [Fistulifera solaris]|eukprot:GAX29096.1 hypothetical protein FisN_7Hh308 [Fistulifera solaris]